MSIPETSAVVASCPRGISIAWRWMAAVLLSLFLAFGLLGYFWLPGFAKGKLESVLGAALHRPVSIEGVSVSPYALSATIEGLKVGDLLSVASLHLDVSSASLFRGLPVITALRVEQPRLHLVRDAAGRLSVDDLLTPSRNSSDEGPLPEFAVGGILLQGGEVVLDDRRVNRRLRLEDLRLELPFITSVASRRELYVEPVLSARFNGAAVRLQGRLRPFQEERDGSLDLTVEGLDLAPLAAYAAAPLALHSARLGTQLHGDFRAPRNHPPLLRLRGDATLEALSAELLEGRLRVQAEKISVGAMEADLKQQRIALKSLDVVTVRASARSGGPADFLSLGHVGLANLTMDLQQRRLSIAEARLEAPDLKLRRTRSGRLDLAALADRSATGQKPAPASEEGVPPQAAWSWSLDRFVLADGRLGFVDDTLPEAKPLRLTALSVELGRLESGAASLAPLKLGATVNGRGRLDLKGRVGLQGEVDLAVDARQVDLVALQGWAAERFNALLTRGELGFKGQVRYLAGRAAVNGDLLLGGMNVLDRVNAEDLLRWKRLKLGRLSLATAPLALRVGDVALNDFFAKVLLNEQGQLNLRDIVKHEPAATPTAEGAPGSAPATKSEPPADIRIGRVSLAGGEVNFTDRYIRPNYSARLTDLAGQVEALTAGTLSPVELQGRVDGSAPLKIQGSIDPLSSPPGLDIRASARGIDMPGFSTYSGRYVGYAIEKGKLSVDVQYKVEQGQLTAENKLFLDQLSFGEKVESKDALSIPVHLAVALLKNSRGEIDIQLPISGSLNDPEFSVGGIVLKVLVNLVVKVVTSPFALLGSLFGDGEDLSQVVFPAGVAVPTSEMESRFQALAKAMAERPGLTLEVTGRADPVDDRVGIKRATLDRKLRARKLAEQVRRVEASASLDEVVLSAAEYPLYLEKVYQDEKIPDKPRNMIGLAKSLPPVEMEALLLDFYPAGEAELLALAEQRGRRTQAWLLRTGQVPAERVFLLAPKVEAGQDKLPGHRVDFSLR